MTFLQADGDVGYDIADGRHGEGGEYQVCGQKMHGVGRNAETARHLQQSRSLLQENCGRAQNQTYGQPAQGY